MITELITTADLRQFKDELINDLRHLLSEQSNNTPQKKWLRTAEVRKLLKISAGTLQNLRVNGTLSYTKIGGTIFYNHAEIDRLIESNKMKAHQKFPFTSNL
jgi:hypothetical protein